MAVRHQKKKASSINAPRRQQQPPRAVAVAFRQRYDEHHNRGGDLESPVQLAAQDPAGDLSAPIPQRNSEPAVMSVVDVPVISALSSCHCNQLRLRYQLRLRFLFQGRWHHPSNMCRRGRELLS